MNVESIAGFTRGMTETTGTPIHIFEVSIRAMLYAFVVVHVQVTGTAQTLVQFTW